MIRFPNCKINIGLSVVEKRQDGYHNLETVFYPVELHDALELIATPGPDATKITITGLAVQGHPSDNLCYKAWQLLKHDFPGLPEIHIHLHKVIPMGAGLGGGSSNGAAALMLINEKFGLALGTEQLADYALRLGSDCPFFIFNQPCYATGRGENIIPVNLDLSVYTIIIVHPGLHISTADAFSGITPAPPVADLRSSILSTPENWTGKIINDFEAVAVNMYPVLRDIKCWLYDTGALYASMTGTGSAMYGIYPLNTAPALAPRSDWNLFMPAKR